ncbi:hypothetical protein [Actinophytocola glycyrrhizae]|uniref:Uncharacterized protein n=1 Tax=Actinophytocola glycyrrhizae TaxID=2044873 RepID=A0ABV9SBQ0_9PSEU
MFGQFHLGRDGPAGNGRDDGSQVTRATWEQYLRATRWHEKSLHQ